MCISSFLVVCFAQFFQIFLDGADGRNPHVTIFVFALSVTHPKKIGAEERERERERAAMALTHQCIPMPHVITTGDENERLGLLDSS